MNKGIIIFMLVLACSTLIAQGGNSIVDKKEKPGFKLSEKAQESLIRRGDSLYAHAAFMESVRLYADVEHSGQINQEIKSRMAEAYRCNAEYELAEYWYRQYVEEGADPKTCLNFAKVLQATDNCEEASKWYKRYLSSNPADAKDIEVLTDCDNLKSIADHKEVLFFNLEEVNTPHSEFGVMNMDEDLVFTSSRKLNKIVKNEDMWTEDEFSDLFVASPNEFGSFDNVDRLKGGANRRFHDGVSSFDHNEYKIYFTRNENRPHNEGRLRELKLYTAKVQTDGTWDQVGPMDLNVKGYSSCHPAISASGNTLIFASNRPGGYGGMDLYISKKVEGKWSAPENLGKDINSPNNEIFPSISNTNDLFFASNGHVGLGGLDIFRANKRNKRLTVDGRWDVQNMGQPFNSTKDDFTFSMDADGLSGYLASNRDGGKGKDDIYRWVRTTEDPLVLDWYTKNICLDNIYTSNSIRDAKITVLEFADRLKYPDLKSEGVEIAKKLDSRTQKTILSIIDMRQLRLLKVRELGSNKGGYEQVTLRPNRDYLVVAEKDGFFTSQKLVTADENLATYSRCIDISLEPMRTLSGKVITDISDIDLETVSIELFNHCTGETEVFHPDASGVFLRDLKCSCAYDVEVNQFGFEKYKREIENYLENCNHITEKIAINLINDNPFKNEKIETGKVFTLKNIFYEFDSADLTSESITELNYLVDLLKENTEMTIEMSSFTDSRGNADYNYKLSERRASSAAGYLFQKGIAQKRVGYRGMGESIIINDCKNGVPCTEDEHQVNRRTEVKIISL